MPGINYYSVFDYLAFRREVSRLVEMTDRGDYITLHQAVTNAARRLGADWPLTSHGEAPPKEESIVHQSSMSPRDVGFWFLILLAQYLEKSTYVLPWSRILRKALESVGWDSEQLNMLFDGRPIYELLKPELHLAEWWPIQSTSEYWLWLHPYSSRSGWIPADWVSRLRTQLITSRVEVNEFNLGSVGGIDATNPAVVRDIRAGLQKDYLTALELLTAAAQSAKDLFVSTSLYG